MKSNQYLSVALYAFHHNITCVISLGTISIFCVFMFNFCFLVVFHTFMSNHVMIGSVSKLRRAHMCVDNDILILANNYDNVRHPKFQP